MDGVEPEPCGTIREPRSGRCRTCRRRQNAGRRRCDRRGKWRHWEDHRQGGAQRQVEASPAVTLPHG